MSESEIETYIRYRLIRIIAKDKKTKVSNISFSELLRLLCFCSFVTKKTPKSKEVKK